jgi:hypothetical protein
MVELESGPASVRYTRPWRERLDSPISVLCIKEEYGRSEKRKIDK